MNTTTSPRRDGWADLGRDFRFGARSLRRTPGFLWVTIVSLGCGLALATTTLAITHAYLIRSLPYPEAKRIYHLRYAPPGPYEPRGMTALDWNALSDVVDATIVSGGEAYHLGTAGSPLQFVRGLRVSLGFMTGLDVKPMLGHSFSEADFKPGGAPVALLGHALWRDRFGSDRAIVGREIQLTPENQSSGPVLIRVLGVLPPEFWFGRSSDSRPDLILPLRAPARAYMIRLREGVPVAFAKQRITEVVRTVGSDIRPGWTGVELESVHERYVAGLRPLLFGIDAAAAVVLVLVCANVAILVLLRALRRQKEVAVRVALGAGRSHLLRQWMAEAGILCAGALLLGVALTVFALRTLGPLIETQLGRPPPGGPSAIGVDAAVVVVIGGVGLVVALAMAVIPLLAPRRRQLADTLRGTGPGATDGPAMRRLRSTLIACEVAGALVLLASGGLMIRSVLTLVRTDLGFDAERVVRLGFSLPSTYRDRGQLAQFYDRLIEQLATASPTAVVSSAFPPFYETNRRPVEWDASGGSHLPIGVLPVGAGYFAVHGVELKQGREFALSDRIGSEPVAVVSESLARHLWPGGSAIGRRIRTTTDESVQDRPTEPWRTVVGVARDLYRTYGDEDLRDIYLPFLQAPTRFANIQIRNDRPAALPPSRLGAVVNEIEPFARVSEPKLLAAEDQQLARARFLTSFLGGFAGFATALALLGIYGVTAYAVQQREREIAIRVAVGALPAAVVGLFLREGGRVLAIGVLLGLGATWGASRMLENQVHGVRPFDLPTIAIAAVFLGGCGALAIWWPARRAAAGNPLAVLKEE